jgi:general secretion pathway protein D
MLRILPFLSDMCFPSTSSVAAVLKCLLRTGAVTCLIAGCTQQYIRSAAQDELHEGQYEKAVQRLQEGIQRHPDSGILRGSLVEAKSDALSALWADAEAARVAGRWADAEQVLARANAIDPNNMRTRTLIANLGLERRQHQALDDARALAAAHKTQAALRTIEEALKDNPRQVDLLELKRQIDAEQRQVQATAIRSGLSESRLISLDFRDANLRAVLDAVSRNSGINFILDKDIRPDTRITVYLRSARVEDAIDLITNTNQLSKKLIDNKTVLIYPNTPDKQKEHQEQVVKVFYLANADAKNAASFLRSMIKIHEPYVDERSNMLAIRESAENIALAERMLTIFDTAEPEVLLDVQVVEINTNRLTELGVKFPNTFGLTVLPPAGQSSLTLGNIGGVTRDQIGLSLGGVTVNLRRETGDYNILANPSIRARNKEKAKILIGDKLPLITTTTGVGGFVSDSVSYLEVGMKLEVEPTVNVDDEVSIRVALEVSSLASQVKTSSGGLAYQIGTRNASTLLRLRDGETQLLAGLINKSERSDASRIPGLGDLPLAGRLFSSTLDNSQHTELVLSITPHVLRNLTRPTASESEVWVGTEGTPRLRPPGGMTIAVADQADRKPVEAGPATSSDRLPSPLGPASEPVPTNNETRAAAVQMLALKWSGPISVNVGEEFSVQLVLQSDVALRGAPMLLGTDGAKLRILEVEEGDFFHRDGSATSFSRSIELDGKVARAALLRNQATGASGEARVLTVRLKAVAPGAGQLRLENIEPVTLGTAMNKPALPVTLAVEVK